MKWRRGDIAIYEGGINLPDLTIGATYVVNNVGSAHGRTYLQIITDDREVDDVLASHFRLFKAHS